MRIDEYVASIARVFTFVNTNMSGEGCGERRTVLLRLDEPTPAVAMLGSFDRGGAIMASMNIHDYGESAA